ncbi:toll/interleukin-1 receptor domain-containing protein [Lactococcus allomyrinae]|uniref:Toll/interleukin-1 receptor domain-containing protein n=1 Tax=Lactococcus allomyrinae TaxID=2419773 RepID=A0A387BIN2_9LACT|nr:toll/interleukin-1 receptor domain-containing protein [Lactococcus allomyrinae]AYG02034.1 toll/interleukin-1 receptor domain-containing protein [Lactococcus allomyrinae]
MIEEKFEKIYDFDFCKNLLEKQSNNWKKMRFEINQTIFGVSQNYKLSYLLKINFETHLRTLNRTEVVVKLDEQNIIFLNRINNLMKKTITIKMPYEDYDTSYEFIDKINQLVSNDGVLNIFANNVPYRLEYGLVIETLENFEEIVLLTKQYSYQIDFSFGLRELIDGMHQQQYNVASIHQLMDLEEIKLQVSGVVLFDSKRGLENKGIGFKKPEKKKVFISYSHQNKDEVNKIVSQLQSYGLNVWWDQQDIDFGDSIMENIQQGIETSDLWLVFLSSATLTSMNAKEELKTFYNRIISSHGLSKKWFIVRLDKVDPSQMLLNLGDYKYYDLQEQSDFDLYKALSKKLKKLK